MRIEFEGSIQEVFDNMRMVLNQSAPSVIGQTPVHPTDAGDSVWIDRTLLNRVFVELCDSGKKITAIKLYRAVYQVGLKEAKDAIDLI